MDAVDSKEFDLPCSVRECMGKNEDGKITVNASFMMELLNEMFQSSDIRTKQLLLSERYKDEYTILWFLLLMEFKDNLHSSEDDSLQICKCCNENCRLDLMKIIEFILEKGFDVDSFNGNDPYDFEVTALYICARYNHLPLIRLLRKYGAKSSLYSSYGCALETPLAVAFDEKHFQAVREMAKGNYDFLIDHIWNEFADGYRLNCIQRLTEWSQPYEEYWNFIVEEYEREFISEDLIWRIMAELEIERAILKSVEKKRRLKMELFNRVHSTNIISDVTFKF